MSTPPPRNTNRLPSRPCATKRHHDTKLSVIAPLQRYAKVARSAGTTETAANYVARTTDMFPTLTQLQHKRKFSTTGSASKVHLRWGSTLDTRSVHNIIYADCNVLDGLSDTLHIRSVGGEGRFHLQLLCAFACLAGICMDICMKVQMAYALRQWIHTDSRVTCGASQCMPQRSLLELPLHPVQPVLVPTACSKTFIVHFICIGLFFAQTLRVVQWLP